MDLIYIDEDNLVQIDELQDATDNSYINDATITAELKTIDADGNADQTVSGSGISLTYVTGSNGKYQGIIPETVSLTANTVYLLQATGSSSGRNLFRQIRVKAAYHKKTP